jgi:hypothetical protein
MIQYFKRSIYTLLLSLLVAGKIVAQDPQYFVYIQHEKSQPFYVKYKGKLLSSSERGYIILSELPAGTLPITIGFPKNEAPEQEFKVRLGKNDQGFLLKKTDEKSFALYNLQTFAVTMAGSEGGENGRLQALDDTAGTGDTAAQPLAGTETAAETVTPAPPAEATPAPDTSGTAMMAALKKDLDSVMAGKADVSNVSKPEKKTNKFAETLDKVVSDDRPDDISLEEPAAAAPAAGAAVTGAAVDAGVTAAATAGESKKARRKRNKDKNREPLTEEEQALLKDVLAEEKKIGEADSLTAAAPAAEEKAADSETSTSPVQPAEGAQSPVAATDGGLPALQPATEEAPVKKSKKSKRKKGNDPEFIEFMDDSTQERVSVPATETASAPVAETSGDVAASQEYTDTTATESKKAKRKKRKLADIVDVNAENPNNIVTDNVDYDAPAKRAEKKSRDELKMINSDCENMMDDAGFRKLLRKFASAKDDEGMIEAFRRNTRSYCLETDQIRKLAQLMSKDEYRYQLLDMAYPKAYDSERYAGLSDLLTDSYYQGRFKAMLHK